jgi:hypothetical protein
VFVQWPTKSNRAFPGRVVAEEPADVPVALPGDVTGQTAAQQTCAHGYKG